MVVLYPVGHIAQMLVPCVVVVPVPILTTLPAVDALYQVVPVLNMFATRLVMCVAAVRVGRAGLLQEFGAQAPLLLGDTAVQPEVPSHLITMFPDFVYPVGQALKYTKAP